MNAGKRLVGILTAMGMLILILDSKTAFIAAGDGAEVCLRIIIPSIFPFMVLSILLNQALLGMRLPFLESAARLLGLPKGTSSILISSFLGGYPAGAHAVAQHHKAGAVSKNAADKLLAFTNNAGPSFIFGMLSHVFTQKWIPWTLWIIQIISAYCVSFFFGSQAEDSPVSPSGKSSAAMDQALRVTATVCGWVILFRIIIDFINRRLLQNASSAFKAVVSGLLELSNGCLALEHISDYRIRFLLCCAMLSFGGLCVTMQTFSIIRGLRIKYYLTGKMLQTSFSIIIGSMIIYGHWQTIPLLLAPLLFILIRKNYCRNNAALRV